MKQTMKSCILEQPDTIRRVCQNAEKVCDSVYSIVGKGPFDKIYLIGSGTSLHTAIAAKYAFTKWFNAEVQVFTPFDFLYYYPHYRLDEKTLILGISQTARSIGTIHCLEKGREYGARTVMVTAEPDNPGGKSAEAILDTCTGEELVGAKTKGFTSTIAMLYLYAAGLAGKELDISLVPKWMEQSLRCTSEEIEDFAEEYKSAPLTATIPVVSCFFGALCGSALATANTLSTAMVPELEKKGYDKAYLAALIAASSPFGFMIPPNVNAIIFASVSSASVGALFMATIVPGLIWAGLYLIINRIIYIKYYHPEYAGKTVASVSACTEDNEPKEESEKNARETISRNRFFLELVVAVLMPVIVLGGIYGGIFTATEAGAITCLYGAIMGVVVYKKLSLVQLMGVFSKGVKDVSALVIMFPMTLIFSRLMTLNHIPELVAELMLGITNNRIGLILLIDLLLFFIGFFLDGNVIILTLVPLLTPIATACGIDTIQLAVIVFVSIGIGSITPPMATCLMACSRVCDVPIHKLIKPILPFLLFGALPILLLVSFVPVVSTWLPGLFYSF